MNTKKQLEKFERNLDVLKSITRAFEHSATKRMEVNKREIEGLDKYLLDVKQTYVNIKISVVGKGKNTEAAYRSHARKPTKQKIVVLVSSEPSYYGHLLNYMVDSFLKEVSFGGADALIIGKPGREEFDKKNKQRIKYAFYDFDDSKPNWNVVHDVAEIMAGYAEIQVIFSKYKSIMTQDVRKQDVAQEITNVRPQEHKKYLIKPEPATALSFLEKQIITSQLLQKLYENGLAKNAIRVKILEIGEIAERLSEHLAKFEKFKRKVIRNINNRKLAGLYSSSDVWQSSSIFTIYR
ncbi:hypothetical protein A3A54_02630 [Candidatus Curtissbacteria bacterium RIFCSPLOWO2_01_FULL_39_62]|uniref:Uncharacterized protein n=2 Tax=Candidatus Curtissiibacteriota TaxID=1752717 RepID=A0A1F5G9X9_9BACT|nr:MAG: hypothetical protein A2775_00215 [Candidatus Curtissbacteria bacterium RIFCSPHIGHO2_01_FULL_39_57]OGD88693.1 MAG: hypothetical protein A3D04_03710 [Candidatus Curtissbacteria bacterium RIFCSPHIGHO2_02_FULL_40_16b]OGE00423.1 MAG: hypothetical protein A3J17_01140 [Candidatus Curtissbacteria bacterium RIFCSPLOWO2_02_FULL_40_11]OGE01427.1 MAG: hypothetical protein A3A54_02630 [Candidatus Curtissbacteria bacterium RIFCSPLOWO2_01_FULL_39_62]OGE13468.1 MAG: hypothetical protein A3G14_03800 [Ca